MAKKNAIVSVEIRDDLTNVLFTVAGVDNFDINVTELSKELLQRAAIHGIVQKISDAAALGKDASPEDKFHAMRSVAARLIEGDWNKSRGGGEGSGSPSGLIFRAFYQFAKDRAAKAKKPEPSQDAVRALYDSKSRAEQLALRAIPEIATIMESMRAKKSTVDTDGLLGELDSI